MPVLLKILGWAATMIWLLPIDPMDPRELVWGFNTPELNKLLLTLPERGIERIWSLVGI